jgi:hypothetical protein
MSKSDDQYSKQETQQRFESLVKIAQSRPKPIKKMHGRCRGTTKEPRKRVNRAA